MAHTFGANTTDDVNAVIAHGIGVNSSQGFVGAWFYPTTLTAGRGLFSTGTTGDFKVAIDSGDTSQVRLTTDNATTDGEWTIPAGLAVDTWTFIALFVSFGSTGTAAVRAWVGTGETPPQEVTVTQVTAPSGTLTSSTTMVIGNVGTGGSLAWQGDIENFFQMTSNIYSGNCNPLPYTNYAEITDASAALVFHRLVIPFYLGQAFPRCIQGGPGNDIDVTRLVSLNDDISGTTFSQSWANGTSVTFQVWTRNGTTLSQRRCPRPVMRIAHHPHLWTRR